MNSDWIKVLVATQELIPTKHQLD